MLSGFELYPRWVPLMIQQQKNKGTQREYSSKPLKHSIVKRFLVFKRYIKWAYFYPLKILHLFGFPS